MDKKISQLNSAGTLTGAEEAEVLQIGANKRVTLTTIKNWIFSLIGNVAHNSLGSKELASDTEATYGHISKTTYDNLPKLDAANAFSGENTFADNVGIGTSDPSYPLHVQSSGNAAAVIKTTGSINSAVLYLGTDNSTLASYILAYGSEHSTQANQLSLKNLYGDITFYTITGGTSYERMCVKKDSGYILIGTAPAAATVTHPVLYRNTSTGAIEQFRQLKQTSVTSSATPTPTGDARENEYYLTALAAGATFAAPSGTPANGNSLVIRIKDDGTARSLAYNSIYRAVGVTLPTTTVVSKTLYLGAIYNSAASKFDVVSVIQES